MPSDSKVTRATFAKPMDVMLPHMLQDGFPFLEGKLLKRNVKQKVVEAVSCSICTSPLCQGCLLGLVEAYEQELQTFAADSALPPSEPSESEFAPEIFYTDHLAKTRLRNGEVSVLLSHAYEAEMASCEYDPPSPSRSNAGDMDEAYATVLNAVPMQGSSGQTLLSHAYEAEMASCEYDPPSPSRSNAGDMDEVYVNVLGAAF